MSIETITKTTDSEVPDEKSKKLYIKTWGCQMNVYDSKRMADVLRPMGYTQTEDPEQADMMILNTCHIREKATEKVFSELGRLKKQKDIREAKTGKKTVMAVAGCVAQAEGDVITDRAPYVDMVFGPQTYHELPEMLNEVTGELEGVNRVINTDFPVESKFDFLPQEEEKSGPVAYLSIQEGCDKFCTFCVVPYTRGAEYSRDVPQIITEAKQLVKAGAREIQLLGQNVNAYHGKSAAGNEVGLAHLIQEVANIDGVERIRYTTSHPRDMDDELIAVHGSCEKLMPFLHLPVQSGSNTILKTMNRKHSHERYREIIDQLREARPDLAFSSDFIVGFPGETDQDHADSLDLIKYVNYASCYSFIYSARPGTPGAVMQGQIHPAIAKKRLAEMQELLNKQQVNYNESFIGQTLPILFDRPGKKEGQLMGRSPYMHSVFATANPRLLGEIIDVKITHAHPNGLSGDIVLTTQVGASIG